MSRYNDWRAERSKQGYQQGRVIPESTYYKRVRTLRRDGFLDFEIAHFAVSSIGSPGMRAMRKERRRWFEDAADDGVTYDEWYDKVVRKYRRNGWLFPETSSIAGAYNPWDYLEHVREKRGMMSTPTKKQVSVGNNYDEVVGPHDALDRAMR